MIENRITVLRDKPDLQRLKEYGQQGFQLFLEKATGLYYLEPPNDYSRDVPFQDYYHEIPIAYNSGVDFSFLQDFKKQHPEILNAVTIETHIVEEALALSELFQTRVLSAYGNDEGVDFVAVAENGKLLRLRFEAGRKNLGRISNELASSLITEISATRILPQVSEDSVFEFHQYEALQTESHSLRLYSYWHFYEGELGDQVVFSTISSTPEGTEPNLMFRNVYLEFDAAFGQQAPDFSLGEVGAFELIDSYVLKPTLWSRLWNILLIPILLLGLLLAGFAGLFKSKSLLGTSHWNQKKIVKGLGLAGLAGVMIFVYKSGTPNEKRTKPGSFKSHCQLAGGEILATSKNSCQLESKIYGPHNLPGEVGETRLVVFEIDSERVTCPNSPDQLCWSVNGEPFLPKITGILYNPGASSLIVADRTQLCDISVAGDCDLTPEIFSYELRKQFSIKP